MNQTIDEKKELSDEVVRAQGYCAQARYYIDLACGLLEMAIVMSEGEWTPEGRNVYARILLDQVLTKRSHPGGRRSPHPHIEEIAETVSDLKVPPGRWVFYFDKGSSVAAQRGDDWQVRVVDEQFWIHDMKTSKDVEAFTCLRDALFAIQDEDPWQEPTSAVLPSFV